MTFKTMKLGNASTSMLVRFVIVTYTYRYVEEQSHNLLSKEVYF